ncbi:MAG: monomethylamine:corrinoid methyltransferase [Dehalococcoidia bacterium]
MIPIIDFQERALTGPVMKADEFDLEFSMKVRELTAKHNIKYNPDEIVVDDATADAVFQAGMELLAGIGILHIDTERVIKFTREEIDQVVEEYRASPGRHTFGKGKDECTIEYRTAAADRPTTLYAGAHGVAEDTWYKALVKSFAQEETIEALGICPGLAQLGDIKPKAGTLSELHAGFWEQARIKEVLQDVGRPDMHCGLLATVSTAAATFAMIGPGLREAHNTQIGVHIIPEQKISWNQLILAQFCRERGIVPWQSAMSMIGGLCRNAAEASVGLIANLVAQLSYASGPMASIFSSDMKGRAATLPSQWAISAAARASERNIKVATGSSAAGVLCWSPFTLLQAAAMAALFSASGMAYCWTAGWTGIEARYVGEVLRAVAGMPREKANELILSIMRKTDEHVKEVKGNTARFPDVYDIETAKPKQEFIDILERAKGELAEAGVPFK